MITLNKHSLRCSDIAVGDEVKPFDLAVTSSVIVAGAIASHDYMPVHHDAEYAKAQGAPDMFMNILATNGYVSRFLTDWAGPQAMVKNIKIRLGAPAVPNQTMHFTGQVTKVDTRGGECVVEVSVRAANDFGDHATGSAVITLPIDDATK